MRGLLACSVWFSLVCSVSLCSVCLAQMSTQEASTQEASTQETAVAKLPASVSAFLEAYCVDCHSGRDAAGDRRFDVLTAEISDDNALIDYQDILDQLNLGEMPPEEELQPSVEERLRVTESLTTATRDYHASRERVDTEVTLRRLNAREYRNTIRDLLRLNTSIFDPTQNFPRDNTVEHLDNVGASLVTSGHLLMRYLEAAEASLNKAMYPLEKPEVQTWRFEKDLHQQPEIDQVHGPQHNHAHLTLYEVRGADKHEGAYAPIHAFADGVPFDGFYEIEFEANSLYRDHPYDDDFLGRDRREPLRLGIVAGNRRAGPLHKPQPVEPMLAELALADGVAQYSVRVWLDQGYTPRFTFENGSMNVRNLWTSIQKRYPEQFGKQERGIVFARRNAILKGKLPQIHVDNIHIRGPFFEDWPTASQRAVLGDAFEAAAQSGELSQERVGELLSEFLLRAFRRQSSGAELARVLAVMQQRCEPAVWQRGQCSLEAYRDGLSMVLCSPSFLFLDEGEQERLSSHALASRLSYFLWSSMPDERLLELAERDALSDSEVLLAEVARMLDDARSDAFVHDFLNSWLTLRQLGSTPPDRRDFADYYRYDLGQAMLLETRLFTRCVLDENLDIGKFLNADFSFINKRLASHYQIPVPEEIAKDPRKFVRVDLPSQVRGGLLGQASVLTVTANGFDTSPVVRGVWMLENILGTPPSPPPPDVEPLDPDVRGAKTIRDQLEKHRNSPTCLSCHRKIDPLGFALENFDAIGRWRDDYSRNRPVDAAGELPGGRKFEDVRGLKEILLEQQPLFAKSLTEKLLAYASGRRLHIADRPDVDAILAELEQRGSGFRDLLELVVLSRVFQSR